MRRPDLTAQEWALLRSCPTKIYHFTPDARQAAMTAPEEMGLIEAQAIVAPGYSYIHCALTGEGMAVLEAAFELQAP